MNCRRAEATTMQVKQQSSYEKQLKNRRREQRRREEVKATTKGEESHTCKRNQYQPLCRNGNIYYGACKEKRY
jgi:hypothetical protein